MALAEEEFNRYCRKLKFTETARLLIEQIRHSEPSRRVRSRVGNVCVRYPSQKMGCVIQAESHRVEFAGILEYEFTPSVLEYYDQPPSIQITYQTKDGKCVAPLHTPDFFVLRADSAGWEEWKTEEDLCQLSADKPNRYVRDVEGNWRCPPGEQYAVQNGLSYRVRSSAEIDWCWQRNISFLADYLLAEHPALEPRVVEKMLDCVTHEPGLTLSTLLQADLGSTPDDLYALIATGQLYVDLYAAPLAEPEHVHVFRDPATAQAYAVVSAEIATKTTPGPERVATIQVGRSILWDGQAWTIANVGDSKTSLVSGAGTHVALANSVFQGLVITGEIVSVPHSSESRLVTDAQDILIHAGGDDLARAQARYAAIGPLLNGRRQPSTRTQRHWLKKYHEAEHRLGSGYLGLIDQRCKQGNRASRLDEAVLQLMATHIRCEYETIQHQGKHIAYGKFVTECEKQGLKAPSHATYYAAINHRERYEQTKQREGAKAAYPDEPCYWELTLTTPRHGDWPFQIAHIDHTQLDIELVHSRTRRSLGKPWATFVVDAYSRRMLAVYVSFDEPSYRSCMMAIRALVAHHHRLPGCLVVDGGPEFKSIYFESLIAYYRCWLKTRPGGKPRFGSVIERLFGTTNQDFVHNLLGNTQIMRKVRQVTKAVNPKAHAAWTLEMLSLALCEWAYEIYDTLEHTALGQSPRQAFLLGLAQTGSRPSQFIAYDENFLLATLPTTPKGAAKVEPNRGVKIHHLYYWSEAFRSRLVEGRSVQVRYDPFDAGIAYAFIPPTAPPSEQGRWVRCISEYYSRLKGRSERELQMATAELRRQQQLHATRFTVRAKALADFLDSPAGQGVVEAQHDRDDEAHAIRSSVSLPETEPDQIDPAPEAMGTQPMPTANPPSYVEHLELYEDF